jgi:hypothetical protein
MLFPFHQNYSINYWISEGVPRRKIVMGMPLYGQSFQLAESSTNGLNARAPGPGQAGEFTRAAGFLAYYEVCCKLSLVELILGLLGSWPICFGVRHPFGAHDQIFFFLSFA